MNICLLNDSFPPVIDGVVNVVMNYANYLIRDFGCKVMVGTPKYPDTDYTQYPYKVVPYPSLDTTAQASGYRTGNPLSGKAVSEMAAFAPDLIHAHCPASSTIIARILREETHAPVIFTYHTKYDIDIRRVVKSELVAQEGIRAMVSNIEACDEIWVVSRGAGESLKELGFRGDYRVMNNGVDFAKGRVDAEETARVTEGYDLPPGVPVFLFVGRLMNYKGLPLILDALKLLADCGQDFRMVFVGKGPDADYLKKRAVELGLMRDASAENAAVPDRVLFVGPVYDRDELRAWNTRADLFLFPSTFDTNGLVVREAAACGLASVLVRDSCAAEGITDGRNGFLIDETAESMAALLSEAVKDLAHLHDVGQRAMDEIYMSWESCVAEAHERYQEVLDAKAAGLLPAHAKQPGDRLVEMTARRMQEQAELRAFGKEWLHDFRDGISGMMENIQEVEDYREMKFSEARDQMDRTWEKVEHVRRKMDEAAGKARGDLESYREELRVEMDERAGKMKEEIETKSERFWQQMGDNLRIQMESLEKDI